MNILRAANELQTNGRKVCLAIGFFDGVHMGHQQIIRQTVADARQHYAVPMVLTFDKHPNVVVAPDKAPLLIYALPQKLRAIESAGTGDILLIDFDRKFSERSAKQFIAGLAHDVGQIHSVCVGVDFVFGHNRGGNVALLRRMGDELGFQVHGLSAVSVDGQVVSSTRIREAIRRGDFDAAGQMVGRSYALCGTIVPGDSVGRKLGFPTANLDVAGLVLPPNGVYAAVTKHRSRFYRVALNIGWRPTVSTAARHVRVEAHLLDFQDEQLYGQELEIEIGDKLRDEMKFASTDQLKEQIARDVAAVRAKV